MHCAYHWQGISLPSYKCWALPKAVMRRSNISRPTAHRFGLHSPSIMTREGVGLKLSEWCCDLLHRGHSPGEPWGYHGKNCWGCPPQESAQTTGLLGFLGHARQPDSSPASCSVQSRHVQSSSTRGMPTLRIPQGLRCERGLQATR